MKNRNLFWGIFFILAAISIIAIQLGTLQQFSIGSIVLGFALIAVVIHSIIRFNAFGVFFPLSILYILFWQPMGWPFIDYKILICSGIFASIGVGILTSKHQHHKYHDDWHKKYEQISESEDGADENNPFAAVKFASTSKFLHADSLKSGKFSVSFGELKIFFDQSQLDSEGAEIYLDCNFGSLELNVPKDWKVEDRINVFLGNVEEKVHVVNNAENVPTLLLTGNVQFGEIAIKRI